MYEKILVPLDGSITAEMVIPYAEEMAARLGSEVILTSVSESVPSDAEQLYRIYLDRITQRVQNELKDWKPTKEKPVQNKVLIGKPAEEILRYADETNTGLIALTSRGLSNRGPWLLGNIVEKVIRATSKPLLLIRAPASESDLQKRRLVKKILVPLDGSELGATALPYAEVIGQALDAELVLFHALELIRPSISAAEVGVPSPEVIIDERRMVEYSAYLNSVAERLKQWGLKVSTALVRGSPADQIIDYAKKNSIDLIAMSTHGRTGIGRWVFGSVTDKVLHAGDTPILVIRAQKT